MVDVGEQLRGSRAVAVRMLRILLFLRQRPHTLGELAQMLGKSQRTIRRDLYALRGVPFPIDSRFPTGSKQVRHGVRACDQNEWFLGEVPAWPRREVVPIADVSASPLPPFPQGPLFPPGIRP